MDFQISPHNLNKEIAVDGTNNNRSISFASNNYYDYFQRQND